MAGPAISQSRSQEVSSRNMAALFAESTPPKASSSQIILGPIPDWSYMACSAAMNGCIRVTTLAPPDSSP